MKKRLFLALLISFLAIGNLLAQDGGSIAETPMITDRPSQTYSSFVVPKSVFQIESGFGYAKSVFPNFFPDDLIAETYTLNFIQLRYGLSDNVELRLAQNIFFNRTKLGGFNNNGDVKFAPTWIGAKVKLFDEDGIIPQSSILVEFVTDVFDENMDQDFVNLRLNLSNTLSEKFVLGYGLGGLIPTGDGSFNFQYTVIGSYALQQNLGAFLEFYGTFRNDFGNSHNVDFGFTYLVNNNFQLDAYTGFDLTNNFDDTDFIFGFGFSTRILKK